MSQHDDLYAAFTSHLDAFAKHRGFVAKAQALADQYRPEVVKVVVDDHTEKSMAVVGEIMSVLFEVEGTVESLGEAKSGLESGVTEQRIKMEELELNLMIEAISQADFDAQATALQAQLADVDEKVGAIQADLERFTGALARWAELGTDAGVLTE